MYCKVILGAKQAGIMNGLTYAVGNLDVRIGSLVKVPLRNRLSEGIVVELMDDLEGEFDVKAVSEVAPAEPLLTTAQIDTVRWMADYYMTTLRHAINVWLPPTPWSKLLPQPKVFYRLRSDAGAKVRGKKLQMILDSLHQHEWMEEQHVRKEAGASVAQLKSLVEKNVLEREERLDAPELLTSALKSLPVLTPQQQAIVEAIRNEQKPTLIFGVTGSGKTEIYAELIADTLRVGKQAMVLVPEILLTEHAIHRYESLVDRSRIAVIHSRLTEAPRRNLWMKARNGEIALVIGSRSALFAPLPNLGMIVMDEEHEWTYKNEQMPRYHARDVAQKLAEASHAKFVLGSATPSLESWKRAKDAEYQLCRLPMRYLHQSMPDVRVVDLANAEFGQLYPFSPPLLEAIRTRLERKEQSVLFLNRRGIATSLLCLQCRRRVVSPDSQLPFTVHHSPSGTPYLMDHTTGLVADLPATCPHCGSTNLLPVGAGTQKLEQIVARAFPKARVLRADSDTLTNPEEMRELLKTMRDRNADILLGTQAVVKGLDLPEVTLSAVLLADVGLSLPHFRAGERTFQLLTQLAGRSGRAKPGEVIIQTFRPDASEIALAAKHETEKYLDQELKLREHTGYPPMAEMIRLIVRDANAKARALRLCSLLQASIAQRKLDVRAHCAPTFFGGGREWHVLLRGMDVRKALDGIALDGAVIDVDPLETV